jgi:hypothetical protein
MLAHDRLPRDFDFARGRNKAPDAFILGDLPLNGGIVPVLSDARALAAMDDLSFAIVV